MLIDCLDTDPNYFWVCFKGVHYCSKLKVPLKEFKMALLSTLNPSLPALGVFFYNNWWDTRTDIVLGGTHNIELLPNATMRITAKIKEVIPIYTMGNANPRTFVNGKYGVNIKVLAYGLDVSIDIPTDKMVDVLNELSEMVDLYNAHKV